MRMTREELFDKYYTSWNEEKHDIVACNYGDIPLVCWDGKEYEKHRQLDGSLSNVGAVYAYMYMMNGAYDLYRPLIGETYIAHDGKVLGGSLVVKHRGKSVHIDMNNMYGRKGLSVMKIGMEVVGWRNEDGNRSPSIQTKEMDIDTVKEIINMKLEDYGIGVQAFMEKARELFEESKHENWIMIR